MLHQSSSHRPYFRFAAWLCVIYFSIVPQLSGHEVTTSVAAKSVDFKNDVAPILRDKCVECHDAKLQMADLRLDSRQAMVDAGVVEVGASGRSGDADDSLLVQRLHDREHGILMPPSGRLEAAQVETLKKWISVGAPWPDSIVVSSLLDNAQGTRPKIFDVVRNENVEELKALLRSETIVASVDRYGATPLMYAAMYASVDHVRLMLEFGAEPNAEDNDGLTPLMYAAGSDVQKTELLIRHGAKVDTQSNLGRTALLIAAAFSGNTPVVKALVDAGADVNYADRRAWTAVVLAARTGDVELVRTLLDFGGDVNGGNAKRLSPGTPLMQAAWASDVETAKLLLTRGAGAVSRSSLSESNATFAERKATVQRSLDASLIAASTHGCAQLVELLLDAGADPHTNIVTNYIPESPILAACGTDSYDVEIVKRLIAEDVDVDKKDNRGESPLSLAKQRGNTKISKLLRKLTADSTPVGRASTEVTEKQLDGSVQRRAGTSQSEIRKLTQKSLSLLQSCGPRFFANSGCTACHQQTATSLVVQRGRERGLLIDERTERQQVKLTAFDLARKRTGFVQRMKSGGTTHRLGYLMWGLAAAGYPADDITDVMYSELAGLQMHNGSWVSDAHRPPTEYSPFTATAVSMRAIQDYSPPGLKSSTRRRIARATQWLTSTPAVANAEKAFRILGLHWGEANQSVISQAKDDLLKQQSAEGGWAQLADMQPDAYATGLTLFALAESGALDVDDPVYRRGVEFLVRNSKPDGSWHVGSRSFAFQPYFESGFPHGTDQWISAAATGWSTLALLQTQKAVPKVSAAGQKAVHATKKATAYSGNGVNKIVRNSDVEPVLLVAAGLNADGSLVENYRRGLRYAIDYFGNYGPYYIYLLGPGNEESIRRIYRKRAESRAVPNGSDSIEDQIAEFLKRPNVVSEIDAVLSGKAEGGLTWTQDSPLLYEDVTTNATEREKNPIENTWGAMHEYHHVFQMAHCDTKQERTSDHHINSWMAEGMATYSSAKFMENLSLVDFKGYMRDLRRTGGNIGQPGINNFLSTTKTWRLEDESYWQEGGSAQVYYMLGAWATAYLIHVHGVAEVTVLKDWYRDIPRIGKSAAFKKHMGLSLDDFYMKFESFIRQSDDVVMKIFEERDARP